jgi:DNA-binding response OmpR family regulator
MLRNSLWSDGRAARQLREAGYDVQVVDAHRAALDTVTQSPVALLVVDGATDPDVYRALRARSHAPILALAPQADEKQMMAAFAAGVDDFQPGVIGGAELIARAKAMIRRASPTARPGFAAPWSPRPG